jgi:hypothetical protein
VGPTERSRAWQVNANMLACERCHSAMPGSPNACDCIDNLPANNRQLQVALIDHTQCRLHSWGLDYYEHGLSRHRQFEGSWKVQVKLASAWRQGCN